MIALVLHHARVKALGDTVDCHSKLVKAAIAKMRMSLNYAAHSGYRQAPFPTLFKFLIEHFDKGIDQHGAWNRWRIGIAFIAIEAEDHQTQIDADLRCGEPCAIRRLHGLKHVRDEDMQLGSIEFGDFASHAQKPRISHSQDWMNHDAPPF